MPTLKTVTLGCKVNQYETEWVREGLISAGYQDAAADDVADLCVVNTCTVTTEGDAKSRGTIRKLARANPGARIVVMGCYATRAPEELANLPGVVEVVTDKRELPDLLGRFGVVDVPTGISQFSNHHRAFIKVQDGCLLRCSFCIIPYVRPHMTSRPIEHILDEVRRLYDAGFKEFVLTGIHLGHYGVEWNRERPKQDWTRLSHLVEQIVRLPLDLRVRLSSIEATEVTRELIQVMADYPDRVAPHLHISLQSGSDSVLRRMRRRWGRQRFVDRCELVKKYLDRPAITTDIIVGFPGETDAEFAETLQTARDVGFSRIHVFPFSARRGTPADAMPDQISPPVKQARVAALNELERELREKYFAELCGRTLRVLVESPIRDLPGYNLGTACRYAAVELPATHGAIGEFVNVSAGESVDGRMRCFTEYSTETA